MWLEHPVLHGIRSPSLGFATGIVYLINACLMDYDDDEASDEAVGCEGFNVLQMLKRRTASGLLPIVLAAV